MIGRKDLISVLRFGTRDGGVLFSIFMKIGQTWSWI